MSHNSYKEALELFIPLLRKAVPHLKGEHSAWDSWAEEILGRTELSTTMTIYGPSKGFLTCLERFSDLRVEEEIYDPRWKKARFRADIAALAMVIVHGDPKKTHTALRLLSEDIDVVFKQTPG